MKTVSSKTVFLLILMLFLNNNYLSAQSNQVKGTITLSKQKKLKRVSRGKAYRNRIKDQPQNEETEKKKNWVKEVIVSLKPVSFDAKVAPLDKVVITQKNKTFSPNVVAITKGTTVDFVNQDDFYHNVFSVSPKARFNIGRRPAGSKNGTKIKKAGVIKVFCDIHPQMKATIISLDTPYFTSLEEDGTYSVKNLPDGKYELTVYHPDFKKISIEVDLNDGEVFDRDFTVGGINSASIIDDTIRVESTASCCSKKTSKK